MLDFNLKCECQLAASDGQTVVIYPRLSNDDLRGFIDDASQRGLTVLAVALFNCSASYVYDWRATLQNKAWLGRKLTMKRKRGEYRGTQDVLFMPAKEQVYTLAQFERLLLGSG